MTYSFEAFNHSSKREVKPSSLSLTHFCAQIESIPQLMIKAFRRDQALLNHFKELKLNAGLIIQQIKQEESDILGEFEGYLKPIAKEVLSEWVKDAEQLKENLDQIIENFDEKASIDWIAHAKKWSSVCNKWQDQDKLANQVLELVSDRTSQLIDKDIKIIEDYQLQSLIHLAQESEEFQELKGRLSQAIAQPLKHLLDLKNESRKHVTLKQASDWIAHMHSQREGYFDQLLMRIDSIVKEVVQQDEDPLHYQDILHDAQSEFHFMENELKQITEMMTKKLNQADFHFLLDRLASLNVHLEQFDTAILPKPLQKRLEDIKYRIEQVLNRMKDNID